MLTVEERKNRLEALLSRVRSNRKLLQEERAPKEYPDTVALKEDSEAVLRTLPPPEEPKPVSLISRIPPPVDTEEPYVPVEKVTPSEPSPVTMTPQPEPEFAPVTDEPRAEVVTEAPSAEPVPEPVAVESAAPSKLQTTVPADAVYVFEAETRADEDVVVVHGQLPQEWTLQAILTRAWKLGLSK